MYGHISGGWEPTLDGRHIDNKYCLLLLLVLSLADWM